MNILNRIRQWFRRKPKPLRIETTHTTWPKLSDPRDVTSQHKNITGRR